MKNKNSPREIILSQTKFLRSRISLGKKTNIKKKFFRKALSTLILAALFCLSESALGEDELICSDDISVNEIFPFSSSEFVEVINNGKTECYLEGWSVSDALGKEENSYHRKYFGTVSIKPLGYAIIEGNLYLNDGSDDVKLYDSKSVLKETVSYVGQGSGKSFSFFESGWIWNDRITKGEQNQTLEDENGNENQNICLDKILINEINPFGEEFVEVYNLGDEKCSLKGWRIEDNANHKVLFSEDSEINPGEFLALYGNYILNDSSGDGVNLFNHLEDKIENINYPKPKEKGKAYGKLSDYWKWTSILTPNEKNKEDEKVEYADHVRINEILPNPSGNEEEDEFIELFNQGEEAISLRGWLLKDSSSSGKYEFEKDFLVKPGEYRSIYRKDFGFALNNSGDERVLLVSPLGETISLVEYDGADEDVSYNFDGKKWRWSKDLTPGEKNIFNNLPKYSIDIPEQSYKNVYTYFEVKANDKDGDKVKTTWDFGDGHKSYKMETKHKYLENGKFQGSLKITDGSEDILEKFEIEIKNLPHPKVKIVSVSPNPIGKDSELETITIKNDSKKKINLKGWSVATGWKNLINHPIRESFEIKPGKEKVLTRELSAFSLNNKKQKIELRYPDGKVAYDVKYKSEESVEEGMIYKKEKGKRWEWKNSNQDSGIRNQENTGVTSQPSSVIEISIKQEDTGKKSEKETEDVFEKTKEFSSITFPKNNLSKPFVLGVNALWVDESGFYRFIYESPESEHYAKKFFKDSLEELNVLINNSLNNFQ